MEERKGFLTSEQEQVLDDLIELKGMAELIDGTVIKLTDNMGLEKLKAKIPADILPTVYAVVDEIFAQLAAIAKK